MCVRVCQCSRLKGKYMSTIRMREKASRERLLYKVTYTNKTLSLPSVSLNATCPTAAPAPFPRLLRSSQEMEWGNILTE